MGSRDQYGRARMEDEYTPLIQRLEAQRQRSRQRRGYTHPKVRHTCTLVLSIVPVIVAAAVFVCIFFPQLLPPRSVLEGSWPHGHGISPGELESIITTTPDPDRARQWSKYYTSGPHLAGKNLSQAIWTKERWQEFGIKNIDIVSYDVYINYPAGHRLALLESAKGAKDDVTEWKVKYEASLEEDILDEDPTSALENRIPTFHGYSASGNVTAPYVFVNYGTYWDFEDLVNANVTLKGKIALAKYGGIFRGLKVKRAQELGMVGVVIYTDPGDDGEVTEHNGYEAYPNGPARHPSSVQRGSTQFLSISPGDPTTPGYPSKPGVPREPVEGRIPSIPSIPISYQDALPLLKALNGHGPKSSSFNKYWQKGGLQYKGIKYNIGPSPDHLVLNLVNEQDYVTTPLWNVIGVINGTISDEVVVLGNHRDAWIAGGAGDPNSGSAAMNEVIRSFGKALEAGWKPLRTIVLASWDGEEYGLIGSTEWVEEYIPWLKATTVAYLNVDVGARGPEYRVSAAPLLNKLLIDTVNQIQSPNQTVPNQTVGDVWNGHIATMGSGSDFTAFQDYAGIPCIDMGFSDSSSSAVYQYHSNYDSLAWMDRFGDPGFKYHATIAKIWALLALKLVESPVIPLNATDYATGLAKYLDRVKDKARSSPSFTKNNDGPEGSTDPIFDSIDTSIRHLYDASVSLDDKSAALTDKILNHPIPWWQWWRKIALFYKIRKVNTKYKYLERHFLYSRGLDGRSWFKHVVFAPGIWTGYAGATFPGLVESIDNNDRENAVKWAAIIAELINEAADWLVQ